MKTHFSVVWRRQSKLLSFHIQATSTSLSDPNPTRFLNQIHQAMLDVLLNHHLPRLIIISMRWPHASNPSGLLPKYPSHNWHLTSGSSVSHMVRVGLVRRASHHPVTRQIHQRDLFSLSATASASSDVGPLHFL